MPKFKIGDQVQRRGMLVPQYLKNGVVTRVIPNKVGQDWFTEYEVKFGGGSIATLYETELRLVAESSEKIQNQTPGQ